MQALALAHLFTATPPRISAGSTVYCQHLIMRIQVITVQSSSLVTQEIAVPIYHGAAGEIWYWSKHVLCTVGDFCVLS